MDVGKLNPKALGQLLLMQTVLSGLPDEKSIFSFVCRGLLDIPGVDKVDYSDTPQKIMDQSINRFPITVGGSNRGELLIKVSYPSAFAPYEDYIKNFCFIVAIILEERSQRLINEQNNINLEQLVEKRTKDLQESEGKFRSLSESSQDYIMLYDKQCRHIYMNPAGLAVGGTAEEDIIGKTHHEAGYDPQLCELWGKSIRQVFATKEPAQEIFEWESVEGKVFLDWRLTPVFDETGKVETVLGIARDITERKKAEDALKISEKRYRTLIESSTDCICHLDIDGKFIYMNPAGLSHNELNSFEEIKGHSCLERVIPEYITEMSKAMEKAKRYGSASLEYESLTTNGKTIRWESIISPIADNEGNVQGLIRISRDITEQKAMRQQLMQSEKLSSIGTFISGIAHELNNPLMSVLGYSQKLMDSKNMPQEAMDDLEVISKQSKRTAKIVHELLKFSRTHKAGKANLDVNNAVESILDFYSHTFKADNIELKRNLSHDIPKVFADSNQLQQVFTNIIVNAYHEVKKVDGQQALTVETMATDEHIFITFENSGSPIPEEAISKIFDPFFTTKEVGKGTGLGLYVSYGIIKDHGGDIKAENIGNSGVRFIVSLPVADEKITKEVETTKTKLTVPKGIRLLFVEDEEPIRKYISSAFSKDEISVHLAKDGKEAIELIEKTEYDIILSDIKMPTMNGYELCEWLHENKPYYLERFVLATGIIDVEVEEYCHKYHCLSIIKPYSKEEVLGKISELADKYNLGNKEA